jgi:hypothetical protein
MEQQRVLRAVWCLQVHQNLHLTALFTKALYDGPPPYCEDDDMYEVMSGIASLEANGQLVEPCDERASWDSLFPLPPTSCEASPTSSAWQETLEDAQMDIKSRVNTGRPVYRFTC